MRKDELLKLLESYNKYPEYFDDYSKPYCENLDLRSEEFKGFISDSWSTGGMTGGNCWGGEANERIYPESEKEFTTLTTFLKDCLPELTYSQYETLLVYVNEQEYNASGYYRNYEMRKVKYIAFKDLINFIQKNNLTCINPVKSKTMSLKG